jgi:hypothetical protein
MRHASWLEFAWLMTACIGWIIKLFLTASSRAEYRHAVGGKTVQVFMARALYMHMLIMFWVFNVIMAAALWGMFNAPPPPPLQHTQSFGNVLFWMLTSVSLTIHALLVARWWTRMGKGRYNGDPGKAQARETQAVLKVPEATITLPATLETKISETKEATTQVVEEGDK